MTDNEEGDYTNSRQRGRVNKTQDMSGTVKVDGE